MITNDLFTRIEVQKSYRDFASREVKLSRSDVCYELTTRRCSIWHEIVDNNKEKSIRNT